MKRRDFIAAVAAGLITTNLKAHTSSVWDWDTKGWGLGYATELKVHVDLTGMNHTSYWPSDAAYEAGVWECLDECSRVCNVGFVAVSTPGDSHFHIKGDGTYHPAAGWTIQPSDYILDGPKLGHAYCAINNLMGFYDQPNFLDVCLHEIGHVLGLSHGPNGSLMHSHVEATYNGVWQTADADRLVDWYGEPVAPQSIWPPDGPQSVPSAVYDRVVAAYEAKVAGCVLADGRAATEAFINSKSYFVYRQSMFVIARELTSQEKALYHTTLVTHFRDFIMAMTPGELSDIFDAYGL